LLLTTLPEKSTSTARLRGWKAKPCL